MYDLPSWMYIESCIQERIKENSFARVREKDAAVSVFSHVLALQLADGNVSFSTSTAFMVEGTIRRKKMVNSNSSRMTKAWARMYRVFYK